MAERAPDKARFWNRIARKYARDPIADMAGYDATLRRVLGLLSPEHAVLEIGCGTGTTALRLAPATRSLLATDVSAEMIAIAREKLNALPLPMPQLRFEIFDADAPVGSGAAYDAVLAFNLMHLVSDLDTALDSVVAALKPGGHFISKTPCLGEMNRLIPALLIPILRAIGMAPSVLVLDAAQLRSSFERHGLVIEAIERHGSKRRDARVFIVARKPG
jgi:SAM-dependent methyltransferase